MNKLPFILVAFAFLLFSACEPSDNSNSKEEIICSTIFKTVNLEIIGSPLDSFYTIQLSNQEALTNNPPSSETTYPVVSDRIHSQLINSQDSFLFVGLINDSIVVSERYIIAGDDCHINYVSGKTRIEL